MTADSSLTALQRHVAGATVSHDHPFPVPPQPPQEPLTPDLRDAWVRPLYMGLHLPQAAACVARLAQADDAVIARLLGQFDWRSRKAGASLAAWMQRPHFTAQLGGLLLASEVCYAGSAYCLALAAFDTPDSRDYLHRYLAYYLRQPKLHFEQAQAMAAIAWLDGRNGRDEAARHAPAWRAFLASRPGLTLDASLAAFAADMDRLRALQALARAG
ncbi:hypothetical protein GQ37_006560 [Janthinobacterium sp. BJB1]|uniref:DUF6000 family protein n=1 Tax=Janthinobacterium sp. GW458P TaxID=1981504 RepID=UPI000A3279BE|nr:DUF6000 family protein [Janthinobacterium sp. GW458P]MBE3024621.1 hypothetical protein [Janthinobacterium sp. GW458P]PJC99953.1 hypothetical protein GQ37_006560 [Janthinobacterium sp. BJB1]